MFEVTLKSLLSKHRIEPKAKLSSQTERKSFERRIRLNHPNKNANSHKRRRLRRAKIPTGDVRLRWLGTKQLRTQSKEA